MKMTRSRKGVWKIENNDGCETEQRETEQLTVSSKAIRRWGGVPARGEKLGLFSWKYTVPWAAHQASKVPSHPPLPQPQPQLHNFVIIGLDSLGLFSVTVIEYR